MSQLEAVLQDAASLIQFEAASLSLKEAPSLCLLDREGAPSPFVSVSFVKSRERSSCLSLSLYLGEKESSLSGKETEREREGEQLDDRRRPSHPTDKRRASHCTWDPAAPRTQLCRLAAHLRRSPPETRSSLSRPEVASLSLLEAASLSQLEAVLLDVASLSQLEAASLSLEEALSLCL